MQKITCVQFLSTTLHRQDLDEAAQVLAAILSSIMCHFYTGNKLIHIVIPYF